jgi:hypothetical protein
MEPKYPPSLAVKINLTTVQSPVDVMFASVHYLGNVSVIDVNPH